MTVRHWMTTKVITIAKDASIQEALGILRQHSIRHLPVVDSGQQLLGWVTDSDLRGVLIASMLEELAVSDVMNHQPHTAHPDMPLEEAARLILEKRIGGLPVVDNKKLVGVITVVDILAAFINMMGVLTSSSRLDVKITRRGAELDKITHIIQVNNTEIISVCHIPAGEGRDRIYSFRLKKCDVDDIAAQLKAKGFDVVSAQA